MTRLLLRARVALLAALGGMGALAWSSAAKAEPVRILVAVGHKDGLAAERPLKYSDADATHVRDVLVSLGGVRAQDAHVLRAPSRAQLFATVDRVRAEAQKHKADEVTLLFYFSGHGDREALHLGDERVLMSELAAKLAEIPAGLRIAVTDACRTNREKGFALDEPFAVSTRTPQATGQIWLHASREGEAAQESDELGGALFTHAWLNGLRGAADANGDSRVTLDESFAFAHSQTMIRSSKSSGVLQKPEAVVTLREMSPIVLTETAPQLARVSLPPARDTHFLIYSAGARSVLSELWGSPDRRIALAVPPGRYVVQRRLGALGAAAQIAVGAGEQRQLEERDFTASSLDQVASKGTEDRADEPLRGETAPERAVHHELAAGYFLGADTRTGLVQGPRATYALAWKSAALTLGGGLDLASRTVPAAREELTTGFGRVGAELRLPVGPATVRLGAGARAGWLAQTVQRAEGSSPARSGAFVGGPDALAVVRAPLGSTLFGELGVNAAVLFVQEEQKLRGLPGAGAAAALGAGF